MYKQDVVKFAVIYYMYETKANLLSNNHGIDFHDYFLRNYTGRNYIALLWSIMDIQMFTIYAWSYKPTIQILAVVQLINWHSCMGRRAVILRIISYDDFNFRYVYHTRHAHHSHTFATLKN
jgi:hypothetical protein